MQPIDKQSLIDSGIFCCLIRILNALLSPDEGNQRPKMTDSEESILAEKDSGVEVGQARRLEVVFFLGFLELLIAFYMLNINACI